MYINTYTEYEEKVTETENVDLISFRKEQRSSISRCSCVYEVKEVLRKWHFSKCVGQN